MNGIVPNGLSQKLWHTRMAAPKSNEDAQAQIALAELIWRVKSVRFESNEPALVAARTTVPPVPKRQAQAISSRQDADRQAVEPVLLGPAARERSLPAETVAVLRQLLAEPNQVSDPLEMAELLFLSGRAREAEVFYAKALKLATRSAPAARDDRAWILLQLGNCLRATNPTQAKSMYATLIAEHADCPWVELARAQSQLITWYETVRPREWITPTGEPDSAALAPKQELVP